MAELMRPVVWVSHDIIQTRNSMKSRAGMAIGLERERDMAQEAAGWHPPNAQELLEVSIPDGSQWYEVRMPLRNISTGSTVNNE